MLLQSFRQNTIIKLIEFKKFTSVEHVSTSKKTVMQFDYKKVNIQITTFGISSNEIKGLPEFREDLAPIYTVQTKDLDGCACGGSSDLDLAICISDTLANIAVSGLLWDLTKGILSYLWNSIKTLGARNKDLTLYISIELYDFNLRISEAMYEKFNNLAALFELLDEKISFLNSEGFLDITNISMPYIETRDKENRFEEKEPYTDFEAYWWKVQYDKGHRILFLNPDTQEIFIHN